MCYHRANNTRVTDRILKLIPFHALMIYLISEFAELRFHYGKTRINKLHTISKCIEVYEESCTSDKGSFLIAIKFQAISRIRIEEYLPIHNESVSKGSYTLNPVPMRI